jgi:hypothetical protein
MKKLPFSENKTLVKDMTDEELIQSDWIHKGKHSSRCKRMPWWPDPAICSMCELVVEERRERGLDVPTNL